MGGDETDFKSDIKITNINSNWEISKEPDDVETIQIDPIQTSRKNLKRKLKNLNKTINKK